jgi:hypothetical protein
VLVVNFQKYLPTLVVQKIPGAWLVQIKGAGHGVMYQYPEKLRSVTNISYNNHYITTKLESFPQVTNVFVYVYVKESITALGQILKTVSLITSI